MAMANGIVEHDNENNPPPQQPKCCNGVVNVSGTLFHNVPESLFSYLKDLPSWCSTKNKKDEGGASRVVLVKRSSDDDNDSSSGEGGGGGPIVLTMDNVDPDAFRWLIHYVQHQSLPSQYWQARGTAGSDNGNDKMNLEVLAVLLGMPELVLYLVQHDSPRPAVGGGAGGLLRLKSSKWKRSASTWWQNSKQRARASSGAGGKYNGTTSASTSTSPRSKLGSSFRGAGGGLTFSRSRSATMSCSYEELECGGPEHPTSQL